MGKNKVKRYAGIPELEKDLEKMNNDGWVIQSISDIGNRILVVYMLDNIDNFNSLIQENETKDEGIVEENERENEGIIEVDEEEGGGDS